MHLLSTVFLVSLCAFSAYGAQQHSSLEEDHGEVGSIEFESFDQSLEYCYTQGASSLLNGFNVNDFFADPRETISNSSRNQEPNDVSLPAANSTNSNPLPYTRPVISASDFSSPNFGLDNAISSISSSNATSSNNIQLSSTPQLLPAGALKPIRLRPHSQPLLHTHEPTESLDNIKLSSSPQLLPPGAFKSTNLLSRSTPIPVPDVPNYHNFSPSLPITGLHYVHISPGLTNAAVRTKVPQAKPSRKIAQPENKPKMGYKRKNQSPLESRKKQKTDSEKSEPTTESAVSSSQSPTGSSSLQQHDKQS